MSRILAFIKPALEECSVDWMCGARCGRVLRDRLRGWRCYGCISRFEPEHWQDVTQDDEQRKFNLNIRLNATELADLRRTAGMTGLPLSTFARRSLLGTPLTVTRWYALAPTDVTELKRLGNLLNQM